MRIKDTLVIFGLWHGVRIEMAAGSQLGHENFKPSSGYIGDPVRAQNPVTASGCRRGKTSQIRPPKGPSAAMENDCRSGRQVRIEGEQLGRELIDGEHNAGAVVTAHGQIRGSSEGREKIISKSPTTAKPAP